MSEKRYLTEKEVAAMTARALPTLRNERHKGQGIPYSKIGKSVRYDFDDVVAFMERHRISTSLGRK